MFNLIGNAIKFTFRGKILIEVSKALDYLVTKVKDTGVGIKPEDQRKLFKFFGKLSDPNKINKNGMGLGLTISKFIVEKLNGEIEV